MRRYFTPGAIPPTTPRDPLTSRCKRNCCWSPYGHIPDVVGCACHPRERS